MWGKVRGDSAGVNKCGRVYGGECGKVRRGVGKGRWGFEQVRGEVAYGKVEGVEKCVGKVRREVWGKVREDVGV